MNIRHLADKLHLWLGIISAPLVFFICITGTIIVFSDEVIELSAGKARYVEDVKDTKLSVEELLTIVKEKFPNRRNPSYLVSYRDPNRTVRFNSYDPEKGLRMVYVDPYTGEILKDDASINFFYVLAHLHNSLLVHGAGAWIIDIATIVFLIAVITGLIMWWPKNKSRKAMRYAFRVKWRQPFGRLNVDIHRVIGMYLSVLMIVLAFTGLIIAFKPLFHLTANTFGGNSAVEWNQNLTDRQESDERFPVREVMNAVFDACPEANEIQYYTFKSDEWSYYAMNAARRIGLKSAMNNKFFVFDCYSGEMLDLPPEAIVNEKVENAIWTLHMGNWMGIVGKIVTFLGGLFASFLPISGLYIWGSKLLRRREKRKQLNLI